MSLLYCWVVRLVLSTIESSLACFWPKSMSHLPKGDFETGGNFLSPICPSGIWNMPALSSFADWYFFQQPVDKDRMLGVRIHPVRMLGTALGQKQERDIERRESCSFKPANIIEKVRFVIINVHNIMHMRNSSTWTIHIMNLKMDLRKG